MEHWKVVSVRFNVIYIHLVDVRRIENNVDLQKIDSLINVCAGEGVMQSVSMMWPRVEIYGVTYCAYTHAQSPNFKCENGVTILSGEWELLTESGSASGIFYNPI